MKNWAGVIVLTLLMVLTGCATDQRKEHMESTLRLYERSIKWGSYANAQTLSAEPEPLERLEQYEEIKVISYDLVSREIVGDFDQINQVVDIKFYHEQQGKIKTVRDKQVWVFDEERDTWVLQSGLPDFLSVLK